MDTIRFVRAGLTAMTVAAVTVAAMALGTAPPASAQAGPGADCEDGMAAQYPCDHIDMDSFLPLPALGQGNGNDIWGWTDPETGKEYAIMGSSLATGFVDVTDPANPVFLGQLPSEVPGAFLLWRDVKVADNFAYIVSEIDGHGMQVFDLTKLRDATGSPPTTFDADAVYTGGPEGEEGLGHVHNVFVNEETNIAYPVGSNTCINGGDDPENGGLHMVDVSDPLNPTFVGCALVPPPTDPETPNNNYVHDVQCVIYQGPDAEHQGSEICFGANEDAVVIYDVGDPTAPEILSITPYDTAGYTHQGWLNANHSVFVFGDETDETDGTVDNTTTYTLDVSDLDDPPTPKAFTHDSTAIDHNLYLTDGFMYQSNYAAGLRIFDLAQSSLLDAEFTEVAFFDVFPAGDPTEFVGTWSNYAFFDSDTVVVSAIFDQDSGLFVLDPNLTKVSINDASATEPGEGTTSMTFEVVLEEATDDPVTVSYETADGSAAAGEDYESTSGSVTIEAGDTTAEITVQVLADSAEEDAETFSVTLSDPEKGLLGDAEATGTIEDAAGDAEQGSGADEEAAPGTPATGGGLLWTVLGAALIAGATALSRQRD
ncbi:MAG: choice-of-anchor B family protein [Nitriliruptorales bacterium]|nr:choice-of-anchor B family protein [Nitriliruptorales bacterium]